MNGHMAPSGKYFSYSPLSILTLDGNFQNVIRLDEDRVEF